MELFFAFGLIYLAYLIFVLILFFKDLFRQEEGETWSFSSVVLIISSVIFTVIGPLIGFSRFDQYQPDIPFAKQDVLTIILLVISSSMGYWISRFFRVHLDLWTRVVLSAVLLEGILLCVVVSIHFLKFYALGLIFPFAGFELVSPIFAGLFLWKEFRLLNRVDLPSADVLPYRNELGLTPFPYRLFSRSLFHRLPWYLLGMFVLLALQVMVAVAFGQQPDALFSAFTHSVGFVFSLNP